MYACECVCAAAVSVRTSLAAVDEEHQAGCSHGTTGPVPGQEQLSQVASQFVCFFKLNFFFFF